MEPPPPRWGLVFENLHARRTGPNMLPADGEGLLLECLLDARAPGALLGSPLQLLYQVEALLAKLRARWALRQPSKTQHTRMHVRKQAAP